MGGHAPTTVQTLDGRGGDAHLDLLPHQGMGHAVEVALDLDVVVDVHPGELEARHLVAARGQRLRSSVGYRTPVSVENSLIAA